MVKIPRKIKSTLVLLATLILLAGALIPIAEASSVIDRVNGFSKGLSYTNVIPVKKTTFVGYDKETLLDDYAYLAAIPTTVFNYEGKLVSHPLLYYEEEYNYEEDRERSFNAYQGIDYFMEDWMNYCDKQMDQMTLINVPEDKIDSDWKAKDTVSIEGDNPYSIAADIALQDWSYSNEVVMAVIEPEYANPEITTEGKLHGSLTPSKIGKENYEMDLPDIGASGGTPKFFEVTDTNYKYLTAKLSWTSKTLDYDLQITDTQLGMLDIAMRDYSEHNVLGAIEVTGAYIRNYGKWKASVTAVPKKSVEMNDLFGDDPEEDTLEYSIDEVLKSMARGIANKADLEITLYPGTDILLPKTPFGCKNIDFKLEWENPSSRLGFTVLDPSGAEICSSIPTDEIISGEVEKGIDEVDLHISLLGETRENENYSICIYSLDDLTTPIYFTLTYSWKQNFTKKEGDCFASATNGAVLASKLNAPLLYVSPSKLAEDTKNALYKLGVKKIYLVNIGSHLKSKVKDEIKEIVENIIEYREFEKIYDAVKLETNENSVVFTTIDPWTYWYVAELKPGGEFYGARFVGPASYIAAHHSCPVVIVENHPVLSQSIVYHTDFWSSPYYKQHIDEANSGNMMITSNQVYEFLEEYDLGRLEKKDPEQQIREKIIIVAGQYDIGMSFDRSLTGAAIQGRFMFSPVDTAYWIARNVFYPALVFENPALKEDNLYITGSKSEVQGLGSGFVTEGKGLIKSLLEIGARFKDPKGINLVITQPSREIEVENPVLMTFNTYAYRFNQEGSKHWGTYYTRADGVIPSITNSPHAIDDGSVPGRSGQYYPDISESEVVPFYAERGGYDPVFSTSFEPVVKNLNQGVLIWVENCHGWQPNGGLITLWDPSHPHCKEENPWRSYEPILLHPGSIRDTIHRIAQLSGINLPEIFKFHILTRVGSTENPDVAHINTQLTAINLLLKKVNSPIDLWGAFGRMVYRDRVLHPIETLKEGLPFVNWFDGDGKVTISKRSGSLVTETAYTGIQWDDALDNLHGCGLNTISCLPAGTYLHLTWLRHGMTWQIIDPWTTTDWAGAWTQMLMKWFAMGETVGEAYERGMRACGPEYSVGGFWWDIWENVCYFGDPDLRPYVPSTEYSDANHWTQEETKALSYDEELSLDGHMPYGATGYPHEKQPKSLLEKYFLYIVIAVILLVIILIAASRGRKKSKKK